MFRSRRMLRKSLYFSLFIIAFFSISIGYAFLNTTLSISGKSAINKNTWNVYFENVAITPGSVTATEDPIIEDSNKVSNFSFVLNTRGDFYEFSVDIVNDGTIDAMIDSIEKTPELTEEQNKYLNYIIEYQNGEQILKNQLIKANEFVRIKVRVEFKQDITAADLPQTGQVLNLGFNVNYVQAENSGLAVKDNGLNITPTANSSLDIIGTVVTIGSEKFYTIGTEGENVKLLSMYNLHVGNEVTDIDYENMKPIMNALSNPTGMQSYKAKGAVFDGTSISIENIRLPFIGVTAFSNEEKHGEYYSSYEGSIVEGYVNDYKTILENRFGVNVVDARLITLEELTNSKTFACNEEEASCLNSSYPWIYSTSYWTGTAYDDSSLLHLVSNGFLTFSDYSIDNTIGVRPVIVMPKSDITIEIKPVANGDINEIGTVVTIDDQQFYTIGTEGNNVKLLSKYNLYVGGEYNDSWTAYGSEATGKQDSSMKGWISGKPYKGTALFSNANYWSSTVSSYPVNVYNEKSKLYSYVENYKNYLASLGVTISESRLITKEELEVLGCSSSEKRCSSAPKWVYLTSYWTGSADSSDNIWIVYSYNGFNTRGYAYYSFGVRPIIVISKDYFK